MASKSNFLCQKHVDEHSRQLIKVLLIEDDEDDYILLKRLLAEVSHVRYDVTWVPTWELGLGEVEKGNYDVCLLDYQLGANSGLDILARVQEQLKTPPIIILTGQGDYSIDLKAMESGAADYLVKGQMSGHMLERSIRYSIDRKRSRDALQESERQLRHLASALLKVQEKDRRRLASELHDDLGQLLMAIKFHIESVLVRMNPDEGMSSVLQALIPSLQDAVERVRIMYTQLMPTALDDLGILATLRWFCREFQKGHPEIEITSRMEIKEEEIPAELKLVIFRIVQDSFKNVADHSEAVHTEVTMLKEDGQLKLIIEDDGAGFDVRRTVLDCESCGLGLMSMERRAELSGGSFIIESTLEKGTSIMVRWPLQSTNE